MTNNISKNILDYITNFIETRFGLYFCEKRLNNLIRGVSNAAKQKNIDFEEYINLILLNRLSQEDLNNLATCLTIGETYFFRDEKLFEVMRQKILPDIIHDRKYTSKSLKIWSAGCSSGEEVYSIAILIKELISDYKNWDIQIIATDINDSFLSKAKKGIYSEWSFRGVGANFKNKYFDRVDNIHYKLKDDIMELVKFDHVNLVDQIYIVDKHLINNIDILFCRNVLMYFSKYQVQEILHRFYNIMVDKGYLVVAPTESLFLNDTSFIPVNIDGIFLYHKKVKTNEFVKRMDTNIIEKNSFIKNEIKEQYPNLDMHNDMSIKSFIPSGIKEGEVEKELSAEDKNNIEEFEKLSKSFANQGKFEEAIKWCKQTITMEKTNPYYYYLLANIQQEQGDIMEAIGSLKKAIYLDADFVMAYFDLGNLNLKQAKYKEAFKNFKNTRVLLSYLNEEDIIPYSEEMTVGTLKQIIESIDEGGLYGER